MEFFKKLVDSTGTLSSNRFAFLFTTIMSNMVFWFTWLGACVHQGRILDVPTGVYIIYGLANGIVGLSKLGQNITENIDRAPQK